MTTDKRIVQANLMNITQRSLKVDRQHDDDADGTDAGQVYHQVALKRQVLHRIPPTLLQDVFISTSSHDCLFV